MAFTEPAPLPHRERPIIEPGLTHISVGVDDLDETCAAVVEYGGTVLGESRLPTAVFVTDPDGQNGRAPRRGPVREASPPVEAFVASEGELAVERLEDGLVAESFDRGDRRPLVEQHLQVADARLECEVALGVLARDIDAVGPRAR